MDTDGDNLPDWWELATAGDLTTLTSLSQDADGDGLSNELEYADLTNPTVADTDGDGLSDGAEVNLDGTSPVNTDTDGDGMPDGWEVTYGTSSPVISNAYDDLDGDRFPNVFEYAKSTNPSDRTSIPTPSFIVDASGGGTHTTISAAMNATSLSNGPYDIIGIAPGTYTGIENNRDVTLTTAKPKLLLIGLEGAAKTIVQGDLTGFGWLIENDAVVSSLTFQKDIVAHYVDVPSGEVRFVDLIVRDNVGQSAWAGGIHVNNAAKVSIIGSMFWNNLGTTTTHGIWFNAGTGIVTNTVVWNDTAGTNVAKNTGATMTTNYCFVKGQTLTGTGNIAGTTDPKFRTDYHLRSDSPLRGAGGTPVQSRIDFDGELRPSTAPDIGIDQFFDSDSDALPDFWEVAHFGSISFTTGTADNDNDGATNLQEYNFETDPLNADTDHDGADDGVEIEVGTNPLVADFDDVATDSNHDGIIDSIDVQLGYQPNNLDNDGDGVSNADEAAMCTNPFVADTDGDGVPDNADPLPLDPLVYALPSDPDDVTPPAITLTAPWYAVEQ